MNTTDFNTSPPEKPLEYGDVKEMLAQFGDWSVLTWGPELEDYAQWEASHLWEDAQARRVYNLLGDGSL